MHLSLTTGFTFSKMETGVANSDASEFVQILQEFVANSDASEFATRLKPQKNPKTPKSLVANSDASEFATSVRIFVETGLYKSVYTCCEPRCI